MTRKEGNISIKTQRDTPHSIFVAKTEAMNVPARIYVSEMLEATIDKGAVEQSVNVACLPGIVSESIAMPDVHIGYGFPIGGVAAFDAQSGIISPGGIGFDINCGVRLLATSLKKVEVQNFMPELLELLGKAVPAGTGRESSIRLSHAELDEVLRQGASWAKSKGYATNEDIERTEEKGRLAGADPAKVSGRAKDRGVNQLGTLGSGNHFLEIQAVEKIFDEKTASAYGLKEGQVAILIHCGSRGLGHQVCSDYLRLMEDEYPDIVASIPEKNLMYAPIQSELGIKYRAAMEAAANFAWCNRQIIAHQTRSVIKRLFPGSTVTQVYDVSHNIAKFEEHTIDGSKKIVCVHRKGATRSFAQGHTDIPIEFRDFGQPVLVPGSMGTASWVLAGADGAMKNTFGSCCHGAGRAMSRTSALEKLSGQRIKQELKQKGIVVNVQSVKGLAEEAPEAYKDVDEVIRVVEGAGLANKVARLVPLGVLKG